MSLLRSGYVKRHDSHLAKENNNTHDRSISISTGLDNIGSVVHNKAQTCALVVSEVYL